MSACSRESTQTERTIIELKQQHYTNTEIAERTGWNIRTRPAIPQGPPGFDA